MKPPRSRPSFGALALALFCAASAPRAQEQGASGTPKDDRIAGAELARVKQEEARQKLESLEATMDRLARMLGATEPQNAAKLRAAFQTSRERLLREGMDRILQFLAERKLDRAVEGQAAVKESLEELLAILLEKDIDPRELIKHIKNVRGVLQDLDTIVQEETAEKIASDQAELAKQDIAGLSDAVARLDDLIRRQKGVESRLGGAAAKSASETGKPSEGEGKGEGEGQGEGKGGGKGGGEGGGEGKEGKGGGKGEGQGEGKGGGQGGEGGGTPGEKKPSDDGSENDGGKGAELAAAAEEQAAVQSDTGKLRAANEKTESEDERLDRKLLAAAEGAMGKAGEAARGGQAGAASRQAQSARESLEAARRAAEEQLERLRSKRDFGAMKKDQDETLASTKDVLQRMKKTPPLTYSPEGGVPGRKDVDQASQSMGGASESLAGGKSGAAGQSQAEALDRLGAGRQQVEETLEALQKALRDRILAYLRERFTFMLEQQQKINRETRSLDSRLRALATISASAGAENVEPDRKDLQRAEDLSRREARLALVADDAISLLEEDGTTLVFPRIVGQLKLDIENVEGLLATVQTGELTQRIQTEIIATIKEILDAIKEAQRSPPPPNPNQGRQSKSGAGPLLPGSAELKMIRSMQLRVNERTADFDLDRPQAELDLEAQRQAEKIADRQKEIEDLFRKVARALGG